MITKEFTYNGQNITFNETDVILVHKNKISSISDVPSPIIRILTKCYYNHAALVVEYLGTLYIAEAVANGFVVTERLDKYMSELGDVREIAVLRSKPNFGYTVETVYNNITAVVDKPYAYGTLLFTQVVYLLTQKMFGKGWWTGKNNEDDKRTIECSEVIANAYNTFFTGTIARTTPADIWNCPNFDVIFESDLTDRLAFDKKYK